MNNLDIQTYDNLISEDFRKEIWSYINSQVWYATWKPNISKISNTYTYVPNEVKSHHSPSMAWFLPNMWMHRTCFASDDNSLRINHPIIWDLWCQINSQLGNKYIIEGNDEDMSVYPADHPDWVAPQPTNPNITTGWRVYTNGQGCENIKRSHGVHRDTVDLSDETSRTILYVANMEWYPSWFAECIFYPNPTTDITGDHQQWQKLYGQQGLNSNIGWADEGKIVSPIPGRIIDYDGRTLHTTRPTSVWARESRKVIAFRVRLKS